MALIEENLRERIKAFDLAQVGARWAGAYIGPYKFEALVGGFLAVLAYGAVAFTPSLAGDDWSALNEDRFQYDWAVRVGRWVQRILWAAFEDNRAMPVLTLTTMMGLLLFSALLLLKAMRLQRLSARTIFVAVFMVFPFWAEPVSFKMAHVNIGVGVFAAVLSGLAMQRALAAWQTKHRRSLAMFLLWAILLFSIAVSCYQPMAAVVVMSFALTQLARIYVAPNDEATAGAPILLSMLILVPILGLALYTLEVQLARQLAGVSGVTHGSYSMMASLVSSWAEMRQVLWRSGTVLTRFLTGAHHLFPRLPKFAFLAAVVALVWCTFRAPQERRPTLAILGMVLFISPWCLGLVRVPDNSFRYNALLPVALTYAGVFALAVEWVKLPFVRSLLQLMSVVSIALFVMQQNLASTTLAALNRRDFDIGSRMLARLESAPNAKRALNRDLIEVLPLGFLKVSARRPFRSSSVTGPLSWSITECGVFNCQPGRLPQLFELLHSGPQHFVATTYAARSVEVQQEIDALRAAGAYWPASGAVRILSDGVVLVLLGINHEKNSPGSP